MRPPVYYKNFTILSISNQEQYIKKGVYFLEKINKSKIGFFLAGVINGLLGAGGGMVAVPLLKGRGLSQKQAQASSIAIILPLSIISAVLYGIKGNLDVAKSLKFIPFGLIGALLGTFIFKKISPTLLKKIFALFMIWAGVRAFL